MKKYLSTFDLEQYEKEQLKFIKENIKYWRLQLKIRNSIKKLYSVQIKTKEENAKGG